MGKKSYNVLNALEHSKKVITRFATLEPRMQRSEEDKGKYFKEANMGAE